MIIPGDEDGHYEVRSRAIFIELCDSNGSIVARVPQSLQNVILARDLALDLVAVQVAVLTLEQLELIVCLVLAQQVPHLLIIDLDHAHADVVLDLSSPLFHESVELIDGAEIEPRAAVIPNHGEGFARASLSIGEYTYIVPLHRGLNQILYLAKNVALLRVGLEDLVKAEGLPLVRQIALSLQFIGSNPLKGRGLVSLLVC